jgi:hypothetical protein
LLGLTSTTRSGPGIGAKATPAGYVLGQLAVKKAPINDLRNVEWAGGGLRHGPPPKSPVTRIIDSRAAWP